MKNFFLYVFALCFPFVIAINIYSISYAGGVQLPFIALTPWQNHMEYGVLPMPINNSVAEYFLKKNAIERAEEYQASRHTNIGFILYVSLFPDVSFEDATRLTDVLLDAGADIDFIDPLSGCTYVRSLISAEHIIAANYLLKKGADLNIVADEQKHGKGFCSLSADELVSRHPSLKIRNNRK